MTAHIPAQAGPPAAVTSGCAGQVPCLWGGGVWPRSLRETSDSREAAARAESLLAIRLGPSLEP